MGMFEKDKEIGVRVDSLFDLNEPFVLWGVSVDEERVQTDIGEARKTRLQVSELGKDMLDDRIETTTLGSAIADKAEEATPEDFPCVVELRKVDSNFGNQALVVQWLRDYKPSRDAMASLDGPAPSGEKASARAKAAK